MKAVKKLNKNENGVGQEKSNQWLKVEEYSEFEIWYYLWKNCITIR